MSKPLLSILIPTVKGREDVVTKLWLKVSHQINEEWSVQVVSTYDTKKWTIGKKREYLYQCATGLFSWQIDDDDDIAPNAIELILEAIKQEPDCITFQESVDIDGQKFLSNFSLAYDDWRGDGSKLLEDGFHYHRTPFFKCVIKTEIAKSVPIPHIRWGEDHQWAQALKPHLKTEVHIPQDIYLYQHISSNPTERYGLDRPETSNH